MASLKEDRWGFNTNKGPQTLTYTSQNDNNGVERVKNYNSYNVHYLAQLPELTPAKLRGPWTLVHIMPRVRPFPKLSPRPKWQAQIQHQPSLRRQCGTVHRW